MTAYKPQNPRSFRYCMPYPYDVLSAAAYPAVTNARATDDYIDRDTQWAIGATQRGLQKDGRSQFLRKDAYDDVNQQRPRYVFQRMALRKNMDLS